MPTTYVADANFLLRLIDKAHPHHVIARSALGTLRGRGEEIVIVAQSLFEFYVVATRPSTSRGGFGFTPIEAGRRLTAF
jgi:predicted nucleic acid-binding protein